VCANARRAFIGHGLAAALLVGALAQPVAAQSPVDYAAIIAAPDRSAADRETDQRRDPVKLLAFTGIAPGMTVLDMGAGGGYSTELAARVTGPTGKVFAQDSGRRERFETRAKSPAMANVAYLVRPFDDPVPADLKNIDVITFFFFYHDTVHMGVDRAAMNKRLFDALKPGGVLIIADHAAQDGAGTTVTNTVHRIEESAVKAELAAAGFTLAGEANFLRNPDDPRTGAVFRSPIRVDEFVLKFRKP
jgi:predicted methyltransferase